MCAISEAALLAQEACFARAFATGDLAVARDLYQSDVVYVSPTVRLFDWPARIDGIDCNPSGPAVRNACALRTS